MKENATVHGIVGPEKSNEAEVIAYISGQKQSVISVMIIALLHFIMSMLLLLLEV